jgi:transposase
VALAALKADQTVNEIASQFQVHPMPVSQWKKQALEGLPDLLGDRRRGREKDGPALLDSLYQQIAQQKVELDWLKNKSGRLGS